MRPDNLKNTVFKGMRARAASFVEHRFFTRFITAVIIVNAVALGLETHLPLVERYGHVLHILDKTALVIFAAEIVLKLYAYRLSFFRAGWNVFDFLIIAIAVIPAVGPFSVLRALRIFRALRLVSVVPQMRRVIAALLHAIPGMASIIAVLLIIFYVSAVLSTKLFGLGMSDPFLQERFGSISASMYTLFQIMTLEGWSEDIVRPVMATHPYAWIFFIPFIIMTSFAVLNLFIGIIVDAMSVMHQKEDGPYCGPERRKFKDPADEIKAMREELAQIKALLQGRD